MNSFSTLIPHRTVTLGIPSLSALEAEALAFLLPLSEDYPGIDNWYLTKVVPGLRTGSRYLLRIERDGELAGIGIGKNEADERKICTVRVAPHFANRGIGVRIFDGLLKWLDDDQPHLTVSNHKLPLFERIFDYYGFHMSSRVEGRYVPTACELGYNELVAMPVIECFGVHDYCSAEIVSRRVAPVSEPACRLSDQG
ncbi:GNAT family N-acetyltransferase [Sphingomonas koreensis]|uniref:GNAT family N-acetyltransferase n=1 Tax=Sphingomonas koreensis TaxID=93064 RepID=UPI0019D25E79|nr:GNAT family N-acetyltransferase [Sphingomonas koreensis]